MLTLYWNGLNAGVRVIACVDKTCAHRILETAILWRWSHGNRRSSPARRSDGVHLVRHVSGQRHFRQAHYCCKIHLSGGTFYWLSNTSRGWPADVVLWCWESMLAVACEECRYVLMHNDIGVLSATEPRECSFSECQNCMPTNEQGDVGCSVASDDRRWLMTLQWIVSGWNKAKNFDNLL